ncbi:hypothetical protein ColLi_01907 [Colletotrichum liriopes]|uniref:Uncharacterized protein n=1 Tax=Colletotrichum liriopes TaxID=708192 RepID=A0AA37GE85_9PEZI|nr:hypothetical protein ColLi_01907 [Colletotrichum liriopes]
MAPASVVDSFSVASVAAGGLFPAEPAVSHRRHGAIRTSTRAFPALHASTQPADYLSNTNRGTGVLAGIVVAKVSWCILRPSFIISRRLFSGVRPGNPQQPG